MPKKYIPVQFAPRLYAEWGELLEGCSTEKKAEYLMAIIKFPNIDIPNDPIWNFIKSQLAKDYYNFIETCKANSRNSSNYWADKRKVKEGERSLPPDIPLLTCDNEGEPKQKQITETGTGTKIDYYNNPIIGKVFEIYKLHCSKLIPLDRFYTRNIDLKKLVGSYLEQTESDLEYFTRVCDIANNIKKIGSVNIDLKMILKNHDGFYNGKYQPIEEIDDYTTHDDSDWLIELEKKSKKELGIEG